MKVKAVNKAEPLPDFDKLWDYEHPDQTEAKFVELLPAARASGDRSYYGELLTQIARSQGLQRNFDAAESTLAIVEKMLSEDLVRMKTRYLLEKGRIYNSSGSKDRAKPFFLEAYELARAGHEDYYAIDAIHMLQIVEPPDKQLEWAEKAIAMAEQTGDERAGRWLGPLYNNTGWTYFDLKQFDKAMELFEKSLAWRQGQQDAAGTRIAKWTIGRTLRETGNFDEALQMQRALENEFDSEGLDPDGYVFEEIAECLLALNQEGAAKPYFKRAYDILSKDEWLVANEPLRLERLKKLGG